MGIDAMSNIQQIHNLANSCSTLADRMEKLMKLSPEAYKKLHDDVIIVSEKCKGIMDILENDIAM